MGPTVFKTVSLDHSDTPPGDAPRLGRTLSVPPLSSSSGRTKQPSGEGGDWWSTRRGSLTRLRARSWGAPVPPDYQISSTQSAWLSGSTWSVACLIPQVFFIRFPASSSTAWSSVLSATTR